MNKRESVRILSIISVLLLSAVSNSCSQQVFNLIPDTAAPVVQPGQTTEIRLHIEIDNNPDKLPGRKDIKLFSESPEISVSNPYFRLLSVKPETGKNGISLSAILIAGESLLSGDSCRIDIRWAGEISQIKIGVKKNPADFISPDGIITDPEAYDALINKTRRLPADYIPEDLVRVEVPTILVFEEVNHLRKTASEALSAMFKAAHEEKGFVLLARSGYRSYKTQVMLYDSNVREHGQEYADSFSAKPGTSEHQTGLVMDISSPVVNNQLTQDFGDTDEGRWVAENAFRFGFIVRYLKDREEITGYSYEPWHLRYVGPQLSEQIYSERLTLEEYYSR